MAAPISLRIKRFVSRMASAFTGMAGGVTTTSWQTGPRMDAATMLKAYESMPWLRTFTQKISHDVATLTWTVSAVTGKDGRALRDLSLQRSMNYRARSAMLRRYAKQQALRDIPNHPLLDMLTGGNEFFPGLVSMQLSEQYLDLIGELAWLLDLNRFGMPVRYMPIPPTWITRLPAKSRDTDEPGTYTVSGPGATYEVPSGNMFFAYHPRPANPFTRGTGLAQVLGDELETDEFAAKHTKDWFRNRAIPPVLISGVGVGLPELQRLEEKWLSKFARVGSGWLPQFMGTKVQVDQLSQSFQQMELGALRKHERDTIRMVYGVPPEIIGDVSASNRSTIDASDFIYQSRVIVPRAEFLRAVLQERVMPLFDERLVLDYISPVMEDRDFMLKVRSAMPYAWDLDEWRQFGGSEALPATNGKVHFLPFNVTPVRLGLGEKPALPPPAAPAPADDEEDDDTLDVEALPVGEEDEDDEKAQGGRRLLLAAPVTRALTGAAIRRISKAAQAAVLTARGRKVVKAVIEDFGSQVMVDLGVATTFDVADPKVEDFLRRWGAERMVGVNETTRNAIAKSLADGVAAGESTKKLAKRVRDIYATASKSRSMTIAKTEVGRASNFGAFEGMRQAGVENKRWLSTQDDHVRDTHEKLDGQTKALMDMFVVRGKEAMFPGDFGLPEEDINCRCGVVMALADKGAPRLMQWRTLESTRRPFERMLIAEMQSAFNTQERAVLAALARESKGSEESWTRTA